MASPDVNTFFSLFSKKASSRVNPASFQHLRLQQGPHKTRTVRIQACHALHEHFTRPLPQLGKKGEDLYTIRGTPPNLYNEIIGDAFAPRNPQALQADFVERPPFFEITPTHKARTWLLDSRAPKIDPPKVLSRIRKLGNS